MIIKETHYIAKYNIHKDIGVEITWAVSAKKSS